MHASKPSVLAESVGPFVGVFSESVTHTLGFGSTKRRQAAKTFWLAERTLEGDLFIQALNKNMVPVGDRRRISEERFLEGYCPEPDLYMSVVRPRMRELEEAVRRGDDHRALDEIFSAEVEYKRALRIDVDEIRANFGLGLTYLAQSDTEKARYVFGKLVALDAAFLPAHKHLFNEFGIALRKNRMHGEAVLYYTRARELGPDDDHLLYNLARAHFEQRQWGESRSWAQRALDINPGLAEAASLLRALGRQAPAFPSPRLALPQDAA